MKTKKTLLYVIVVIAVVVIVGLNSVYAVDMTEQVVITQMGEYVRTNALPGIDFKAPFIQKVHRFDIRVLVSDAQPAEYLTLDKKRLVVDSYARWRITDPLQFYKTLRNEQGAIARLDGIVKSELRTHIAVHEFKDIIGEAREPIMEDVAKKAAEIVAQFGIFIIDVRIKRADLPGEVRNSVFARMNAERQRIAKKYRAEGEEQARIIKANADKESTIILAEAYKESKELLGEGDARATTIHASAYEKDPEFYSFLRSLEAYKKIFESESTLVLDSKSKLFKYLESP